MQPQISIKFEGDNVLTTTVRGNTKTIVTNTKAEYLAGLQKQIDSANALKAQIIASQEKKIADIEAKIAEIK